ncbi:MAG: universal stress protein [Bacteroidales bacterium]|nr:universal stress protein [Bacteroidales bacterium]
MKTQKLDKVLIAIDYDPTAQKVAEVGYAMAKSMNNARVFLLHVIGDPVFYSSTAYSPIMGFTGYSDIGQLQLNIDEALEDATLQYLNKIKQHLGSEDIETIIEVGDFAESILKAANDLHADIIVMGSHSQKWLEKILVGSVTEKVLQLTEVPLLVVPTRNHD